MIPHVNESKEDPNEDQDPVYEYEKAKEIKWYDKVLLNRPLKVFLAMILLGIIAPLLFYNYLYVESGDGAPPDGYSTGTCIVSRTSRLLCGIGSMPQENCHPQCCYDLNHNMCYQRFPSRFSYIFHQQWNEEVIFVPRIPTTPFRSQTKGKIIRISVDEISSTHMSVTFYNPEQMSLNGSRIENNTYEYTILPQELSVTISSIQGPVFKTVRGPLIASDNIWELAFKLTNESMYGLGEIPLKENTVKILYNHNGGLSSIPLIFAKSNGSYHGLLIDVRDPTEVTIMGENQIVVRSLTKIGLKFHVFMGPNPPDIMKEARKLIGSYKQLQYWMLGAHICNEITESYEEAFKSLNNFIELAVSEKLAYESHCGTVPIVLENKCFTEDRYIDQGAQELKKSNKRFVPHLSPYIRYGQHNATLGESEENILEEVDKNNNSIENETCVNIAEDFKEFMIRDSISKDIYKGIVGKYEVIYPDYKNVTEEFLQNLWPYEVDIDAIILENTWPLDESLKNHTYAYTTLPYFNKNFENAFNYTLLWNSTLPNGETYFNMHNEYANNFINAVNNASDSIPTWSSTQWLKGDVMINRQNIATSWTSLRNELVQAALGGISGHWLWSSPICGDTRNFNRTIQSELCVKWYLASTYMPMIKIHSKLFARHPLSFSGVNKRLMINALNQRLAMLPYFYTVLQEGPLLRPMFYQFPSSETLANVSTQFSVGDNLLIVPNLLPTQSHVHVWMPPGTWYEMWSGIKLNETEGKVVTMSTARSDFLVLVRGGSIVPMHDDVKLTVEETRKSSMFSLTVALGCETMNNTDQYNKTSSETFCHASGSLYMSENMTINFEADTEKITVSATGEDFDVLCSTDAIWANYVTKIKVYGLDSEENNYDHYKQISGFIFLCQLETQEEITLPFS